MSEERKEVLRGHIEECVQHLGASIAANAKGWREAAKLKRPGAGFCSVTIDTMARWFDGGPLPVGETLIKLMCYLDLMGYRVIEFERMPKGRRSFAELIGYGLISGKQASELLGYTSVSTFYYQAMRGNREVSKDKDSKMWDVWKERKEELQNRKERALELCGLNVRPITETYKASVPQMQASRQSATVSIMEGLLTLLEQRSDDDLADIKQSADTVLRLAARLSDLSSRLLKGGG